MKRRRKVRAPHGMGQDMFEVINEVVTEVYEKKAIRVDTVLLHPDQQSSLLIDILATAQPSQVPPSGTVMHIRVATAIGSVSVMVDKARVKPGHALLIGEGLERTVDLRSKLSAKAARHKTLFVTSIALFLRREHNGVFPAINEWSDHVIRRVFKEWEAVVVFWDILLFGHHYATASDRPNCPIGDLPQERFQDAVFRILDEIGIDHTDRLYITEFSSETVHGSTDIWKRTILQHGGSITIPKNVKDAKYMYLEKYTEAPHITWVDGEGKGKTKINLDKSKSFQDLAKERESRSNW